MPTVTHITDQGAQTIGGSKNFISSRYLFSGANVIFVNNTGIVSGGWRFTNRPTVNGTGVLLSGEAEAPGALNYVDNILLRRETIDLPSGDTIMFGFTFGVTYLVPPKIQTTISTPLNSSHLYVCNIRGITTTGFSIIAGAITAGVPIRIPETGLRIQFLISP